MNFIDDSIIITQRVPELKLFTSFSKNAIRTPRAKNSLKTGSKIDLELKNLDHKISKFL